MKQTIESRLVPLLRRRHGAKAEGSGRAGRGNVCSKMTPSGADLIVSSKCPESQRASLEDGKAQGEAQ